MVMATGSPSSKATSIPWTHSDSLVDPFPNTEWIALDIETTGLNFLDDDLVLIALSDGERAHLIDVREIPDEVLGEWLRAELFPRHRLIIHNALFDLPWLFHRSGPVLVETYDTMVQQQLLQAGVFGPESLADCVRHYFDVELDKELQTSFDGGDLTEAQLEYAALDAYWTYRLFTAQRPRLEREGLETVSYIERMATPVFAAIRAVGLGVDPVRHAEVIAEYQKEAEEAGLKIVELLGEPHARRQYALLARMRETHQAWEQEYQRKRAEWEEEWRTNQTRWEESAGLLGATTGDPFATWWVQNRFHDLKLQPKYQEPMGLRRFRAVKEKEWKQRNPEPEKPPDGITPLNPNSRDHMLPALADIGIHLPDYSSESIAKAVMTTRAKGKLEVLKAIQDYKKAAKAVSTYGEKFLERRWSDGKFHYEIRQTVSSGRPATAKPNVNQIKNGPLRRVIVPPPGMAMVVADYSQMELRLLAELSRDPVMIRTFQDGIDIHSYTASQVFSVTEPTKDQRKAAKAVNFGIAYGMGAKTLQENLIEEEVFLSLEECQRVIDGWKEMFRVGWEALESWRAHGVEHGWIATAFGRKRWFPRDADPTSVQREAGNHVIQGTNADITKIAMAIAQRDLLPLGGTVVMNVYDELVAQAPRERIQEALPIVKRAMEDAARLVLKEVPIAVDAVATTSWNEDDLLEGATDGSAGGEQRHQQHRPLE